MKIAKIGMRGPRIRASPGHGRARDSKLFVIDPSRGLPAGSGGIHRKCENGTNIKSYMRGFRLISKDAGIHGNINDGKINR